jgi:glycosyltransferase involved in cell wall biosynthesis
VRVNIVCRNWKDDRVLPRFARYLAEGLSWTLTAAPVAADVHYLMGYFECQMFPKWPPANPTASLFTHREEQPPGNDKAKLYDAIAKQVQLRVGMCRLYAEPLRAFGSTIQPPLPVERDRFVIAAPPRRSRPLVGLSGFTYHNARKGEDLTRSLIASSAGRRVEWTASGRGWPVSMRRYAWVEMPRFYQRLNVLVCPSRVEGGPMTVLEALACGVSVVIPRGVGILDELPDVPGILRYPRGDRTGLLAALERAAFPSAAVNREALRATTAAHTIEAWRRAHREGFARVFGQGVAA